MTDVDTILRAHADRAAACEPTTGGWEEIVARLDGDPSMIVALDDRRRGDRRAGRLWLAGAAAAVVVAGAVVLVGAERRADLGPATSTDPGVTATSVEPSVPTEVPATTGPPGSEPVAPIAPPTSAEMPDEVAAIVDEDGDGLGAVVLLGTGRGGSGGTGVTGDVRSVLVDAPPFPDDAPGSATGPVSIDRLPDGSVVYGTCCEPVAGAVYVVGPDGGAPRLLGHGEHPAVSPDGTQVAVFLADRGVGTIDVATGRFTEVLVGGEPLAWKPDDWATGLAWSPDGSHLLVDWLVHDEKMDDTYRVVELVDLEGEGSRRSVYLEGDEAGAAHGTFLADGRVAFVTGVPHAFDQPVVGTGIAVFDPATGVAEPRFGALRITGLDTTADGGWVLSTSEGGAVRAFTGSDLRDEGTVAQHPGLRAAAW